MRIVAEHRDSAGMSVSQRVFAPMIAMGVCQDDSVNIFPTETDLGHPSSQSSGADAHVDQQSEITRANERCIAARTAREHG
jgi:hypothetical protein